MNFPCAVSHDLAIYERELDADYARDRFIETRTEEIAADMVADIGWADELTQYVADDDAFWRTVAEIQTLHRQGDKAAARTHAALDRLCKLFDKAAEPLAKAQAEKEADEPEDY